MNILITLPKGEIRDSFFTREVVEKVESMGNIVWNNLDRQFTKKELKENLRNVDVCISGWGCPKLEGEVLEKADALKLLAHTGGSVGYVASEELYDRNVKVLSGNSIYAESVAEGVVAYILCSLRDLVFYDSEMKKGGWRGNAFYNESLLDKKVGLVGFGAVAKHLTKLLSVFRCKVKVYDPFVSDEVFKQYGVERMSLENIFKNCSIVSLHLPQRPETYHIIDKKLLGMMKEGTLLVNTARGSVVDENALVEMLEQERFRAVLDVYEVEPLPKDSKLRKLKNAILIPHMGGPTIDRRSFVTYKLLEDIENHFKGLETTLDISKEYALSMTN